MIHLQNIGKIYKKSGIETVALKDVTLEIERGEMLAIMGTSGSGKSTLLNIIGGMDSPTSGTYMYNDTEVSALKPAGLHKFRKEHVGFIFQNFELMPQYTVYENVEMPLLVRGVKDKKKRVMDVLEKVGLAEMHKKKAAQLSGGQQQRCAIARALAMETDLILADEPTGALDSKTSGEIMNLLESIHDENHTILIVTHDERVAARAGKIIRIEDGVIAE